jgi:hypothetical protein
MGKFGTGSARWRPPSYLAAARTLRLRSRPFSCNSGTSAPSCCTRLTHIPLGDFLGSQGIHPHLDEGSTGRPGSHLFGLRARLSRLTFSAAHRYIGTNRVTVRSSSGDSN